MDVACLACALTDLKAAQQASQVQYAVAAKLLRTQRAQGAAVNQLIAAAGQQVQSAAEGIYDAAGRLDTYA